MKRKIPDADWQRIEQLWHEHDQRVEQIAHGKASTRIPYWWRCGVAAACVAAMAVTAWVWLRQPAPSGPMLAQNHHEVPTIVVADTAQSSALPKAISKTAAKPTTVVAAELPIVGEDLCQDDEPPVEAIRVEVIETYAPKELLIPAEAETPKRIVVEMTGLVAYDAQPKAKPSPMPQKDLLGNPIREDVPLVAMSF